MEDLIKITPNTEKAKSILKMVDTTLEMIKFIDKTKFPSNVAKEYYEVIRELISVILLLDGYKTSGDGAHKKQVDYLETNYKDLTMTEIKLIDDLRTTRNKIVYDGFFVNTSYIDRKLTEILEIIEKLRKIINNKINK